jgi:hypothetical protein
MQQFQARKQQLEQENHGLRGKEQQLTRQVERFKLAQKAA